MSDTPRKNTTPPEGGEEQKTGQYSDDMARVGVLKLVDDEPAAAEESDNPPPIENAFVTGYSRESGDPDDPDYTIKRNVRPRPRKPAAEVPTNTSKEEEPEAETPQERPGRRRVTNTTNMISGEEGRRPAHPRSRDRNARNNPQPRPAVRVNVEHTDTPEEDHHDDDEVAKFRDRFNPDGELVSQPRNPNRPVRRGNRPPNRRPPAPDEAETLSPARMIAAVGGIVVLLIIAILTFNLISLRGRYSELEDTIETYRAAAAGVPAEVERQTAHLNQALTTTEAQRDEYRNRLYSMGVDPDAPPHTQPDDGTRPPGTGADTADPDTPTTPTLPTTHIVVSGDNLSRIANLYFRNADPATIRHIADTNNLANPDDIRIGDPLRIYPMP